MEQDGILIVLEGSDGSGKTTQFNLLSERLKAAGYDVAVFDFPRYDKESSYFIKQYLNGRYGSASEISPYTASLFYALDRYEAAKDIRKELASGKIVLCNRYVGSNMAHQGSKFGNPAEQRGFFVWEDNLEFQLLDIPRPNLNLFLRVPAEVSHKLISNKQARDYTSRSHDEHEADMNHLKKSVATYDILCQLFPKDFLAIECTNNGQMLGVPQISNLIWDKLRSLLPASKPRQGHSAVVTLTSSASQPSQNSDNMPDKLVHEFKNSSLLLKNQIEKHINSVEPVGFSIWSDNNYQFYTPQGLPKPLEAGYKASMERIADMHKQMRQELATYYETNLQAKNDLPNISSLLLPATPQSALTSFRVALSQPAVLRVCKDLLDDDSAELQWAAKQLYINAKQKWLLEFRTPLESNNGPEPLNSIIAKLAEERLGFNSSDNHEVKLLEAQPRQEFDLLAESIYPYSSLSLEEITDEVSDWSYSQKFESLKNAASETELLQKIHYKFDIISSQITLAQITSVTYMEGLQSQAASPRNGYEVPSAIETAGIDDLYMECFDESLKLYSLLQGAGRDDLCIYATLLGHKLRWQLNVSARDMKLILDKPGDESYSKLTQLLKDSVSEVHPLTWEVLSNITPSINSHLKTGKKTRVKPSKQRHPKPKRRA